MLEEGEEKDVARSLVRLTARTLFASLRVSFFDDTRVRSSSIRFCAEFHIISLSYWYPYKNG